VKVAPQVGLEPIRLRFATTGTFIGAKLRRDLAVARLITLRAKAGNPPVNSRIQPVLPGVAAPSRELRDGAYPSRCQELATCRKEPRVAGSCRELWRTKGKKKAMW